MPSERVVLGYEAGLRARAILLNRPCGELYFERTAARSPLAEIAGLIAHKLSRHVGPPETYAGTEVNDVLAALRSWRCCSILQVGALHRSTFLA